MRCAAAGCTELLFNGAMGQVTVGLTMKAEGPLPLQELSGLAGRILARLGDNLGRLPMASRRPATQLTAPAAPDAKALAGRVQGYAPGSEGSPVPRLVAPAAAVRVGAEYFTAPAGLAAEYFRLTDAIGGFLKRERRLWQEHLERQGIADGLRRVAQAIDTAMRTGQEPPQDVGETVGPLGNRYRQATVDFARQRAAAAAADSAGEFTLWRRLAGELRALMRRIQERGVRHGGHGVRWMASTDQQGAFSLPRVPLPGTAEVIAGVYDLRVSAPGFGNVRVDFRGDRWTVVMAGMPRLIDTVMRGMVGPARGGLGNLDITLMAGPPGSPFGPPVPAGDEAVEGEDWAQPGRIAAIGLRGKGNFWDKLLMQYLPPDERQAFRAASANAAAGPLEPVLDPSKDYSNAMRRRIEEQRTALQRRLEEHQRRYEERQRGMPSPIPGLPPWFPQAQPLASPRDGLIGDSPQLIPIYGNYIRK